MNTEQARVLVQAIAETWPSRHELSPTAVELQAKALEPLSFGLALGAIQKLVATSKFRPSIAEVVEQARLLEKETAPVCIKCGLRVEQCRTLGACSENKTG